jgi:histone acetyltransferase (RNA polymerase elongator complex component)
MRPLIIPFFIPHAGCPHDCVYCNQRLIAGQSGGLPASEQIEATVNEWVQRSPGRPVEVAFFGGSFTMLPVEQQKKLLETVQPMIADRVVGSIRVSTRPDGVGDDTLELLSTYAVKTIELGIQSLDDTVLEQAGRGHRAADSLAAIIRCKKAGLKVGGQLLPCLPADTPEKSLSSLAGIISAGVDFVRIYPAVVLAETKLADLYKRGAWQPFQLDDAVRLCARMLNMACQSNVPVVRIGLQTDEQLVSGETVLAGPWHPAFGQLVRSELYYALLRKLAAGLAEPVTRIECHPDRVSDVRGHERRNLLRWQKAGIDIDKVDTNTGLGHDDLTITSINHCLKGSILTDLNDKEIIDA